MKRSFLGLLLLLGLLFLSAAPSALAQTYYFRIDTEEVNVYLESDGTMRLEYFFVFYNDPSASPMAFVDVGMPNSTYRLSTASATVDGRTITHIAPSEFVTPGVELGLGGNAIPPGSTGQVWFTIGGIEDSLFYDSTDDNYASIRFTPSFFDRDFVYGKTDLTVIFHLPPDISPDEPRWHTPPSGWPQDEPRAGFDSSGRIIYIWDNPSANGFTAYEFGASFPRSYIPPEAVSSPPIGYQLGISSETLIALACCAGVALLIASIIGLGVSATKRRKLAYLPPKIAIEGHGIKRGLTAVEAAVLLETPLDRVLTMMLFSLIKKSAARVVKEDPLEIERLPIEKDDLRPYEKSFLEVMVDEKPRKRRRELQKVMIDLVKAVQKKMKGFSLKETRAYYQAIMKKAWQQVEDAKTPEVRSKRYAEGLEWTMLDREFDERTERTFQTGPVHVPIWWWMFRPSYAGRTARTGRAPTVRAPSAAPGKGVTIPRLPGSEFAASIVNGVQNTAKSMVDNVVSFTNGVTKTTNPPPVTTTSRSSWSSRSGGGGSSCACACACAGCACACAGGGR
jgi:hypothetical protein